MSPESLEWWKSFCEIGGVILLFLTFVLGAGVVFTATRLNLVERQKTAKAQEESAKAQLELKTFTEATFMRTRPRSIQMDRKKFVEKLRGVPPEEVEVLYKPDDDEAYMLGYVIVRLLGTAEKDGLGWPVVGPVPISGKSVLSWPSRKLDENMPLASRAGGWNGVGLVIKSLPEGPPPDSFETPTKATGAYALLYALQVAGIAAGSIAADPEMPPHVIRLVIGPMAY